MPVQLAETEYGQGPPIAILHGLFGSGRNWRSIAQQLAVRNRVLESNGELVIHNVEGMEKTVADTISAERFSMALLGIFAALALLHYRNRQRAQAPLPTKPGDLM